MYGTGSWFRDKNCVPNYECYQQYLPFIVMFVVLFTITDLIYICNKYINGLLLYTNIIDITMRWLSLFL